MDRLIIVGLAIVLSTIAASWSPSYVTDRDTYEQVGRQGVVPDCSSLHCSRILVAWVVEHLPGPSLVKWKSYAVLCTLLAALGVAAVCRRFGLSPAAARVAMLLSSLGSGATLTLLDPHTSDPFIYALTPWMVLQLADGRLIVAGAAAAVGLWAKEFAVVPVWIFAAYAVAEGNRGWALRAVAVAAVVTSFWVLQQLWLILGFNYSYGGNSSAQIFSGGYLLKWVREIGLVQAAASLLLHFGPLMALAVTGWFRAPKSLRVLALASLPAAIVFCYVQQPDRAIWNFQFVIVPLAAIVLAAAPIGAAAAWLASYAVTNLPIDGAWTLAITGPAFAVSAAATAKLVTARHAVEVPMGAAIRWPVSSLRRPWAAAAVLLLAATLVAAADVAIHRRAEAGGGINFWGYRGPVVRRDERVRVTMLGGRHVFELDGGITLADALQELLNNQRLRSDAGYGLPGRIVVINAGEPHDAVPSMPATLGAFDWIGGDVTCLYIGDERPPADVAMRNEGWRRQSMVFRLTGYLPALTGLPGNDSQHLAATDWDAYGVALETAVVAARQRGKVLVALHPLLPAEERQRQSAIADRLRARFKGDAGFEYLELAAVIDLTRRERVSSYIPESLSQAVFRLLLSHPS